MKVTLEQANLEEPEVIIRGDLSAGQIQNIVQMLTKAENTGKMFLYRQEEAFVVLPEEIVYFESRENKVIAFTQSGEFETKSKLYTLAQNMRPYGFCQISKSVVVNVKFLLSVQAEFSGNYTARLKQRREKLIITRKYAKTFKKFILEER